MTNVDLSILIPTYNRAQYLDHLLEFLKNEIYSLNYSYEIIISNNSSTDNTTEITNKHQSNLSFSYHTQTENIGPLNNVNFLIKQAKGRYFIIIADDDIIDFELLNFAIEKIISNKQAIVLFSPWQIWDYQENKSLGLFYDAPEITVKKNNINEFGKFILENKIFPEIGVYKTDYVKELLPIYFDNFFYAFKYALEFLGNGDIIFANIPFYKSLTKFNFHDNKTIIPRFQEGFQQARTSFAIYRNSLFFMLKLMTFNHKEKNLYIDHINQFLCQRLHVGYHISIQNHEFIKAYEIGSMILGEFGILESKFSINKVIDSAKLEYIKKIIVDNNFSKIIIFDKNPDFLNNEKSDFIKVLKKIFSENSIDITFNSFIEEKNTLYYFKNSDKVDSDFIKKIKSKYTIVDERILNFKFQ